MTVRKLGKQGRFANSLFQYAHLRQRAGTDYECPSWIGQRLFGLTDPPPTGQAHDIGTRFPDDASWYDKELFRRLFRPPIQIRIRPPSDVTLIGVHIRHGDYGSFKRKSARWTFVAPCQWYRDWLNANLDRFAKPYLYVATDDPSNVRQEFDGYPVYAPVWAVPHASFYSDFYGLTQCDYLLISNSTFSFAASMLNERVKECWRPRLGEKRLIRYDPWDSKIVLKDELYGV